MDTMDYKFIPMKNKRLSVVILTKNNQDRIGKAIRNVGSVSDDVIIIDDNSIDKTRRLALQAGANVYKNTLEDFSKQRNFGLSKTKHDWVLFLDSDEMLSSKLFREIPEAISKDSTTVGFYLKRKDWFFGKSLKYGENNSARLLRLAKRKAGKWRRGVHETWKVKGSTKTLVHPIKHFQNESIFDFVSKINSYSSMHAEENRKEGKRPSLFRIIYYPFLKFLNNWIVRFGILDGTRGFITSFMMSFHSFLAWSKQWELQKRK